MTGPAVHRDFKVLVHQRELDHLTGWVLESPDTETGGHLFGFWTHSGSPAVQLILGPGPAARHEATAFFQDRAYLRDSGEFAQQRYGLQHIGDWHSHHTLGTVTPSNGDIATARKVFEYTDFERFLVLVAALDTAPGTTAATHGKAQDRTVRIGAYLFERGVRDYRTGRWVVLPDESPTATAARRSRRIRGSRRPLRRWQVPRAELTDGRTRPPAPGSGWYTTAWGTGFLRELDSACRADFADCAMVLDRESGELGYRFRTGRLRARVVFPVGFPRGTARVTVDDGHTRKRAEVAGRDAPALLARVNALLAQSLPSATAGDGVGLP